MDSILIQQYVDICVLFSNCVHRVQAGGGNISLKEGNKIIIKSSGTALSSTTTTNGYTVCNLAKLHAKFKEENESLEDCVLGGAGKPSLETFFHLLPSKIIVHLHPTFFLGPLCSKDVSSIFTNEDFPSSLLIKYNKPGLLLAKDIFKAYNGEHLIFLQNHGIILCGETLDEIATAYSKAISRLEIITGKKHVFSDILFEMGLLRSIKKVAEGYFIKPFYSCLPGKIIPYTPDISLFLKRRPLIIDNLTNIEKQLLDYMQSEMTLPALVYCNSSISYCIGKTQQQCDFIYEIVQSYLEIDAGQYNIIEEAQINQLIECPKEVYRMSL